MLSNEARQITRTDFDWNIHEYAILHILRGFIQPSNHHYGGSISQISRSEINTQSNNAMQRNTPRY